MSFVVVDTDVASAMFRGRVPTPLAARLAGRTPAVTFVTIGELTKWTLVRRWGPRRTEDLRGFMSQLLVLPYSETVARTWANFKPVLRCAVGRGQRTTPGSRPVASRDDCRSPR